MGELIGFSEAQQALQANLSPRYRELDLLESYVDGTQYCDREDWWSAEDVPSNERAPCVEYPIAALAIESHVDFVFGEKRWPQILPAEDAEEKSDEKSAVAKLLDEVQKVSLFQHVMATRLSHAMSCKSAPIIVKARMGVIELEETKAKWTTPKFDRVTGELQSIEIRYPYLEEYRDRAGPAVRCMLYRRVIDAQADTVFKPAKASVDGAEPDKWIVDPELTVEHGLGFCPVHWYAFRKGPDEAHSFDGRSLHGVHTDEIDELNFGLSQKHMSSLVASSGPVIEIGVDEDHNPAPMGRLPRAKHVCTAECKDIGNPTGSHYDARTGKYSPGYVDSTTKPSMARRRGPNQVWRYPSGIDRTSVEQLTVPGDALLSLENNCRDLLSHLCESLRYVRLDPDNAKFSAELSGKAIARLYDKQTRFCDTVRHDVANGLLKPLLSLMLRVVHVLTEQGKKLRLKALDAAKKDLAAMVDEELGWLGPELDFSWPPYFDESAEDDKFLVDATVAASTASLITKRSAVKKLSAVFEDIQNIDEYLDELEREAKEAAEAQAEQEVALADDAHEKGLEMVDKTTESAIAIQKAKPMPKRPGK